MNRVPIRRRLRRIPSPASWEIRTRRLFLIGLPIALPLWIAVLIAIGAWACVRKLAEPVMKLWSDPPKRRYGYCRAAAESNIIWLGPNAKKAA